MKTSVKQAEDLVKTLFSVPLRALILELIALHGEMHGYEIMKRISEITMNLWKPGTSTLYMVLDNLVKDGLLERREEYRGRMKRVRYRVTERGLEILSVSTDMTLKIMYQVIERLETLNKRLRKARPGRKILKKEDIVKHVELLKKIRELIDKKISQLELKLQELQ